jgi:hypothetical protein
MSFRGGTEKLGDSGAFQAIQDKIKQLEEQNKKLLEQEGISRSFKGVWIPKEFWLDPELNAVEKCLLAEIDSLDNGDGCYASNKYFSKFFKQNEGSVANMISKLRKNNYLVDRKFDGRKRWLSVNKDRFVDNSSKGS